MIPNEMSFKINEVLDVTGTESRWWQGKKADEPSGSGVFPSIYGRMLTPSCFLSVVPSNYLRILDPDKYLYKAKTLHACELSPDSRHYSCFDSFADTTSIRNEMLFGQHEILDIASKQAKGWQVKKADGTQGSAYFSRISWSRALQFPMSISCTTELP